MNDELMSSLDVLARAQREKDTDQEEILRRTSYQVNLERFKRDWPELPAPTFLVGISGQWGRGKTSIIIMLVRLWMVYDLFKDVILLSGSAKLDPKMDFVPNTNKDMAYSPENLNQILNDIGKNKGKGTHFDKIKKALEKTRGGAGKAANAKSATATNSNSAPNSGRTMNGTQHRARRPQPKHRPGLADAQDLDESYVRSLIRRELRRNGKGRSLREISAEQLQNMSEEGKAKFLRSMVTDKDLIIFDDSSGQPVLERGNPWYQVIVMLRHLGISALFAYHSWKQLGKPFRKQVSTNIVFPCPPEEREAIGEGCDLGVKAINLLLQAMGRLTHVYLVIHDRPEDQSRRYMLNFRVPLSAEDIARVAKAEEAVIRSQRGTKGGVDEQLYITGSSQDVGGTPILAAILEAAPQLDEDLRFRTLPSAVDPQGLTPRERRALPEAQNLVAQVEGFTYPLVPNPGKLYREAFKRQPRSSVTMSAPATARTRATAQLGTHHSTQTHIRPSSALARSAAARTLDPTAVIANVLQRKATTAAVSGLVRAQQKEFLVQGDTGAARALAHRLARVNKNPDVARQIAKSTTRPDISRIIRDVSRRPLGAGTNVLGRFTGRARLGPTGTAGLLRSRARGAFARAGGRGRSGGPAFTANLHILSQLAAQAAKTAQLEGTVKGFSAELARAQAAATAAATPPPPAAQRAPMIPSVRDDVSMRTAPSTEPEFMVEGLPSLHTPGHFQASLRTPLNSIGTVSGGGRSAAGTISSSSSAPRPQSMSTMVRSGSYNTLGMEVLAPHPLSLNSNAPPSAVTSLNPNNGSRAPTQSESSMALSRLSEPRILPPPPPYLEREEPLPLRYVQPLVPLPRIMPREPPRERIQGRIEAGPRVQRRQQQLGRRLLEQPLPPYPQAQNPQNMNAQHMLEHEQIVNELLRIQAGPLPADDERMARMSDLGSEPGRELALRDLEDRLALARGDGDFVSPPQLLEPPTPGEQALVTRLPSAGSSLASFDEDAPSPELSPRAAITGESLSTALTLSRARPLSELRRRVEEAPSEGLRQLLPRVRGHAEAFPSHMDEPVRQLSHATTLHQRALMRERHNVGPDEILDPQLNMDAVD